MHCSAPVLPLFPVPGLQMGKNVSSGIFEQAMQKFVVLVLQTCNEVAFSYLRILVAWQRTASSADVRSANNKFR